MKPSPISAPNYPVDNPAHANINYPQFNIHNQTPEAALFGALESNHYKKVCFLLDHHDIDLTAVNSNGRTPLHQAIHTRDDDTINAVLAKASRAKKDVFNGIDRYGYTPLMRAVEYGKLSFIKPLIDLGATLQSANDLDCSAEKLASKKQVTLNTQIWLDARGDVAQGFKLAIDRGNSNLVNFLMRETNQDGIAALETACHESNIRAAKVLIDAGVDISATSFDWLGNSTAAETLNDALDDRLSALANAACRGYVAQARALINAGVPPSRALWRIDDDELPKAMIVLCAANMKPAIALLRPLVLGCPGLIAQAKSLGATLPDVLQYVVERPHNNGSPTVDHLLLLGADAAPVLASAIQQNDLDAIALLVAGGVDVSSQLKQAAQQGDVQTASLLIAENPNVPDLLVELIRQGNIPALKTLISAGADVSQVLSNLAKKSDIASVKTLLAAGTDVTLILIDAAKRSNKLLVAIVIAAGADITPALQSLAQATNADDARDLLKSAHITVAMLLKKLADDDNDEVAAQLLAHRIKSESARTSEQIKRNEKASALSKDEHAQFGGFIAALNKADWDTIKSLLASKQTAQSLLRYAIRTNDEFAILLLVAAGVNKSADLNEHIKAGNADVVELLLHDAPPSQKADALIQMVEHGHLRVAKRWPDAESYYLAIEKLYNEGKKQVLQQFCAAENVLSPANYNMAHATARAAYLGNADLARTLIDAGANGPNAMAVAIEAYPKKINAIRLFKSLGIDPTAAAKAALQTRALYLQRADFSRLATPATYRILEADMTEVIRHAAQLDLHSEVGTMIGLGIDPTLAFKQLRRNGDDRAANLLANQARSFGLTLE